MRTLLLLRHAKSSWKNPALDDYDRPLAPRGRRAAPKMAAYLAENDLIPDLVVCSKARRTVETWDLVSSRLKTKTPVNFTKNLYLAEAIELIAIARQVPEAVGSVMLIGHNPGMESAAEALSGPGSKEKALVKLRTKFPTAALAQIDFDLPSWAEIGWGLGRLTRLVYPRDLD